MSDQTEQFPADPATERRLGAAFGALATTEVPAAAPRPPAPRPPVRVDHTRRRRLGLAGGGVLVAAAAVVIALVVGGEVNDARKVPTAPPGTDGSVSTSRTTPTTSGPTTSTPTTSSSGTTASGTPSASAAQVAQAFVAVATDTRSQVVLVPGGYEGADLDAGTIRFWRWDGSSWTVVGTSTYPADAFAGATPASYTATISDAALLAGMEHATFVVTGERFTGDSTGSTLAFTDGAPGWGIVKAGSDGNLHPSGQGLPALGSTDAANIGLSRGESLVDGLLQTVDCSRAAPDNASCGLPQYTVVKYWRWDGTQFVLDH